MGIQWIGGPLDGFEVGASDGIPRPMPWSLYYPCGCVEFVDSPFDGIHKGGTPQAYYPLDEERSTPSVAVYTLPELTDGWRELDRELDVPEPLVTR